jgi:TPP-dependent pyruvate/acetoin dehydrogenase alpha subunit
MTIRSKKQAADSALPPGTGDSSPFSLISDDKLLALYAALLKCRILEKTAAARFSKSVSDSRHTVGLGHEASAVGVVIDLLPGDRVAPCQGDLIVPCVQGEPLSRILASLHPRGATHSRSCAARLNAAVRFAVSSKAKQKNTIAVAFRCARCLQKPSAEALWHQILRRAGAEHLPIVFVCSTQDDAADMPWNGMDHGLPAIAVDGNDVVAIYRVASEAIAHARRGNGPTLIECKILPPSGLEKSQSSGRKQHQTADPIRNMENYLTRKGLFRPKLEAELTAGFERELRPARRPS